MVDDGGGSRGEGSSCGTKSLRWREDARVSQARGRRHCARITDNAIEGFVNF